MQQMADLLGISRAGYCMKENGKRKFTAPEVIKICKFAGIRAEELELS